MPILSECMCVCVIVCVCEIIFSTVACFAFDIRTERTRTRLSVWHKCINSAAHGTRTCTGADIHTGWLTRTHTHTQTEPTACIGRNGIRTKRKILKDIRKWNRRNESFHWRVLVLTLSRSLSFSLSRHGYRFRTLSRFLHSVFAILRISQNKKCRLNLRKSRECAKKQNTEKKNFEV